MSVPAAGPPGCAQENGALRALLAMCDVMSQAQLIELEHALSARLQPPAATPAQERVAELLALAELLESELAFSVPHHPVAPVQVTQRAYDQTRPHGAPSAETLSDRYGGPDYDGWEWACRAAWGLLPDGRKTRPGPLFAQARGRKCPPRRGAEYVTASIRACAFELLRRPSSHVYGKWRRRRVKASRGLAESVRQTNPAYYSPASFDVLYDRFPGGWLSALAEAHITDEELAEARARHTAARVQAASMTARLGTLGNAAGAEVAEAPHEGSAHSPRTLQDSARRLVQRRPSVADLLRALDEGELAAAGITPVERDRLARRGCRALLLSDAVRLARSLAVSLDYLGGLRDDPGTAPEASLVFNPEELRERARQEGVRLTALYAQAKLDTRQARQLMAGSAEPSLEHLVAFARGTRTTVTALTRALHLTEAEGRD